MLTRTKMKRYDIKNADDLNRHIATLKADYIIREELLKRDAKLYVKQFTPANLIKKYITPSSLLKADDKLNISGKLMSLVLPLIVNNTLFRGSGMITKALVGLATNKVGRNIDAESISGLFNTVKSWFGGVKRKKKTQIGYVDYGIPPDSETY